MGERILTIKQALLSKIEIVKFGNEVIFVSQIYYVFQSDIFHQNNWQMVVISSAMNEWPSRINFTPYFIAVFLNTCTKAMSVSAS